MYSINYTKRFEKDLKRCQKRGLDTREQNDTKLTLLFLQTGTHYLAIWMDSGNATFNLIG